MNCLSTSLLHIIQADTGKANVKVAKFIIHPSPKHINTID